MTQKNFANVISKFYKEVQEDKQLSITFTVKPNKSKDQRTDADQKKYLQAMKDYKDGSVFDGKSVLDTLIAQKGQ